MLTMKAQAAITLCLALLLGGGALSQGRKPQSPVPSEFLIGRHTYFDFGPPMDYYELFVVHDRANSCEVERITLTPAGDACLAPPSLRIATGRIEDQMNGLLDRNPCSIPEKDLNRERERCKNCLRYGGADVVMQVSCGGQTRKIRMDILDRDMFDPTPRTPEHTSWTMKLLGKLDSILDDRVMDRSIFEPPKPQELFPSDNRAPLVENIRQGKYDDLFGKVPDKLSQLLLASSVKPATPSVDLLSSTPFRPIAFDLPAYPRLATMVRAEGEVNIKFDVNAEGGVANLEFLSGQPLLRGTIEQSVKRWSFPREAVGREIRATLRFATNCPAPHP